MKVEKGTAATPAVSVRGLSKSFAGRKVVREVDMAVRTGEVHALLGMNGSGKSTLVKMLTGNYRPEAGEIEVAGRSLGSIDSPKTAHDLGIRVVHQEAPLVDTMSVAECIALFRRFPTGAGSRIRWRELDREVRALFERLEIEIDPRAMAGSLTAAQRGLVALAVALGDADIETTSLLILDEASAAIPEAEADPFLTRVRALADQGMPVLMVTHRISEVEEIGDRVTIIRDGAVVHDGPSAELGREDAVKLIAGEESGAGASPGAILSSGNGAGAAELALEVEGLSGGTLRDVSFRLRRGEVLGIAGGPESGVLEIPLALGGLAPGAAGSIRLGGRTAPLPESPQAALSEGIAMVPRDRLRQGGVGSLSVRENILLPNARRYWHRPALARRTVQKVIEDFDVRPRDPRVLLRELSGGNQQKVIIGKWLDREPSVLILDDPTQGVDPGARERIFEVVRERVAEGLAVILLSTEPEQLVRRCDRVLALRDGRVESEMTGEELTHENVSRWAVA